jgi:hypothetical protein
LEWLHGFDTAERPLSIEVYGGNVVLTGAHDLDQVTVYTQASVAEGSGPVAITSLTFASGGAVAAAGGGTVVHSTTASSAAVSFLVGNARVSGMASGDVTLTLNNSSSPRTLIKTGTGTFQLTEVSDHSVPVTYYNDEGMTQFAVDTGMSGLVGGPARVANWSVSVRKPGSVASAVEL